MNPWRGSEKLSQITGLLSREKKVKVSGIDGSAFASLAAAAGDSFPASLFIADKERDISGWAGMLEVFSSVPVLTYPSDFPLKQLETLDRLSGSEKVVIVCTASAASEKVIPPGRLGAGRKEFRPGERAYGEILRLLETGGYLRVDTVGEPGDFSRRGEVMDCWPPGEEKPLRVFFEFEKISSVKQFDPLTQRSGKSLELLHICPADFSDTGSATLYDYLPEGFLAVRPDPGTELPDDKPSGGVRLLERSVMAKSDIEFSTRPVSYAGSFSGMKNEIEALRGSGYDVILTALSEAETRNIIETLRRETGVKASGFVSRLSEGFVSQDLKKAVITAGDLFPHRRPLPRRRPVKVRPVEEFTDLSPGDYVVHWKFGIGEFEGIEKKSHDSRVSDFLKIRFRNKARVYVAVENADLVQKYTGGRASARLDSLSGGRWRKRKQVVRDSVRAFAARLTELYRERAERGVSFPPHPEIEKEFAEKFPWRLTTHQERAVSEVLSDMESDSAMDRLVCGDVGYGKTEVAMRAAFRAVINGSQAAVLVPTTVLARQHFSTFRERFSDFPVIIDMLSRLVPGSDQKQVIEKVNSGITDILIGTHKLFSENIKFPRLGLIIIDEEQRFGVEQKEKLRFRHRKTDLLTTTATPIPRTLAMAMGKVKGFSLINTPPPGRQGVKTVVQPFDISEVRRALITEKERGGQAYFVHSRVGTIRNVKKMLEENVPGVSFGYIHGRMSPRVIDSVMEDFMNGGFDCLVSTTIIENGLDIPSVNTMIIDYAHRLGLADIYQLRGRIGRSDIRAYCYLMYPAGIELNETVKERVSALESFSALGSGFQLALRDLQLRGAGELLGPRQHGNIMKVGFELYSEILKQEVAALRGETYMMPLEVEIQLPVEAYIPEKYIDSPALRLSFYRKLSSITERDALRSLKDELEDRFGPVPAETLNLIRVMDIKLRASKAGLRRVYMKKGKFHLELASGETLTPDPRGGGVLDSAEKAVEFAENLSASGKRPNPG